MEVCTSFTLYAQPTACLPSVWPVFVFSLPAATLKSSNASGWVLTVTIEVDYKILGVGVATVDTTFTAIER